VTDQTGTDRIATTFNRRRFLALATRTAATAAAAGLAAHPAAAAVLPPTRPDSLGTGLPPKPRFRPVGVERYLSFHNLHTDERLTAPFWAYGDYHPDGTAEIDHILRDWRTGEVVRIDRRLFDLLHDLRTQLGTDEPFQVISGYRSPETNAQLRNVSLGVAKNSYHVKGMAIDVRMPRSATRRLHRTALRMQAGGVGYYPKSDFVHVDVGPFRTW
jgi:uncharacterized protein YcbK (DUF882 family)